MNLRVRLSRGEDGTAVVDFVMLLMVLLPFFVGLLQLALVLHVRNTLSSAAAEGARQAAVAGARCEDAEAKTGEMIQGTLNARFAENIHADLGQVGGLPGCVVVIVAEVPALGLGGPGVPVEVRGSAIRELS